MDIFRSHGTSSDHDYLDFEQTWNERFDRLDAVLEELKEMEENDGDDE
jgi:hypothetical protein